MAKILIVDDEPDGRDFLVKLFRYKGHTSLEAADGAEALALVKQEHPDLVITDVLMPTMDGYEFVRQLRLDPAIASTEVIFYSASYHCREARSLAETCGVAHLLTKPIRPDVMLKTVNDILSKQVRAVPVPPSETFDREHLGLITNQLAREVSQLKESNARLTALLDLSRDMVLEHDLNSLLERFADTARDLVASQYAAIGLVNEPPERFRAFRISGLDAETAGRIGSPTLSECVLGAVLTGAKRLRFRDVRESPYPVTSWQRDLRVRSFLGVPVASVKQCHGVLALMNKIGGEEFDEEDERIAVALAAQLAVVYESLQAQEELALREQRLGAFFQAATAGLAILDSQTRYVQINATLAEMNGLPVAQHLGRTVREVLPKLATTVDPILYKIFATGEPVLNQEVTGETSRDPGKTRHWLASFIPIPGRSGPAEAIGVLVVETTDQKRSEAAIREHVRQLQTLSLELLRAQEEERRRLARELHDELGQVLTATSINLQAALETTTLAEAHSRLQESTTIVDKALDQVRNLSLNLRPAMLDDLGLEPALEWLCERQAQRTGLPIHFRSTLADTRLPAEIETACFRIAQESLTNAIRHARARAVQVDVTIESDSVRLLVRDNGVGFDVASVLAHAACGKSFGLLGMQERVEILGGQITFDSAPGQGASVRVQLPRGHA